MNPLDIAKIASIKRNAIDKLQNTKNEAYNRANDLYSAKNAREIVNKLNSEEREIVYNHPLDLFVTPPELARQMVLLADIHIGQTILEPSAGTGRIAEAIKNAGFNSDCIELNYRAAELLKSRGFNVECIDFLECSKTYDRIIMNPPFSNDIDHVKHAYDLLTDNGRVVAIMSEGVFFRNDKKSVSFRLFLDKHGTSEILQPGTFKTSGTQVNARLVIIDK
jgi:hypothetical protein